MLPCKHIFHPNCIDEWIKENDLCPLCRYHINIPINKENKRLQIITKTTLSNFINQLQYMYNNIHTFFYDFILNVYNLLMNDQFSVFISLYRQNIETNNNNEANNNEANNNNEAIDDDDEANDDEANDDEANVDVDDDDDHQMNHDEPNDDMNNINRNSIPIIDNLINRLMIDTTENIDLSFNQRLQHQIQNLLNNEHNINYDIDTAISEREFNDEDTADSETSNDSYSNLIHHENSSSNDELNINILNDDYNSEQFRNLLRTYYSLLNENLNGN